MRVPVRLIGTLVWAIALAGRAAAADRPAYVIVPDRSPIWLDQSRATLFDTPAVSVSVENRGRAPATFTLRIWIFDGQDRLRGTMDYCVAEPLDRAMRGIYYIPLAIAGITARDRGVVTVAAARTEASSWHLSDTSDQQFTAALAEVRRYAARLSLEQAGPLPDGVALCPCECAVIQAACEATCGRPSAFRCDPNPARGCSAGCSCQ
jgi:hypothetical protein